MRITAGRAGRAALAVLAFAMLATGCAVGGSDAPDVTPPTADANCFPAAMSVTPDPVVAGVPATLSAPPTTSCSLGLGDNATYRLSIVGPSGRPVTEFTATVTTEGEFSQEFALPADVPPGPYVARVAAGLNIVCDDASSCAAYTLVFSVVTP